MKLNKDAFSLIIKILFLKNVWNHTTKISNFKRKKNYENSEKNWNQNNTHSKTRDFL